MTRKTRTEMNREPVLFLLVILATTALLGAFSIGGARSYNPQTISAGGIFTPCLNTTYDLNTSVNWVSKTVNALQLDPGTTGIICLEYQFNGLVPSGFTPNIGLTRTVSSNDSFSAYLCGAVNGSQEFSCPGFHVSYAIGTISTMMTVKANITVDSRAKQGIYWLQIKHCSPIVFIIGQPPSKISEDATGFLTSCVIALNAPTVQIVGVSGIRVVVLRG